jgi:3-methylcrotonyl-CoA carboxylase alpha subunit
MENGLRDERLIVVDGVLRAVEVSGKRVPVRGVVSGEWILVWCDGEVYRFPSGRAGSRRARARAEEAGVLAPMPGKVIRVNVAEGATVEKGAAILVLEAMKMEHEILAPRSGRVVRLPYRVGDQVEAGAHLADFAT